MQYLVWRVRFRKKSKYLVNTLTYRMDRAGDYAREQRMKEAENL